MIKEPPLCLLALYFLSFRADNGPEPDNGRDQQGTHRERAGNTQCVQAGFNKHRVIADYAVFHSIINAAAGHHGQHCDEQKAGDRHFKYSCHYFRINRNSDGSKKILHDVVLHRAAQQIEQPADCSSERCIDQGSAMQVHHGPKRHACAESPETGYKIHILTLPRSCASPSAQYPLRLQLLLRQACFL